MPLYDYDCPACGQDFEKRVKISEADAVICPNCGGTHADQTHQTDFCSDVRRALIGGPLHKSTAHIETYNKSHHRPIKRNYCA